MNAALKMAVTLTGERKAGVMLESHSMFVSVLVSGWDGGTSEGKKKKFNLIPKSFL